MKAPFSIRESLAFGWRQTKLHSGLVFKALLTIFAVEVAQAIVSRVLAGTLIGVLAMLALVAAEFVVGMGFILISLRIAQGKHTEYADILPPAELIWRYFLASLLVAIIIGGIMLAVILVGLILATLLGAVAQALMPLVLAAGVVVLVVVAVYLMLRFSMVRFAVLDGAEPGESLEQSSKITRGVRWQLLGLVIVLGLVNLLGAILVLVGLLVTIPVTSIAYAHVYQKLKAK